ncbi:MAG: slipin family protein [Candidatus Izemoplasma sp.]
MLEVVITILVIIFLIFIAGIKIDKEYERSVVFRLGRFKHIKGPGIYWIIPLIDVKKKTDLRVRTLDIASQETVTKDSVTIRIDAVLYFRVEFPEKAIIKVRNYQHAIGQKALTSLRNVIGQHNLDEVLNDRTSINDSISEIVDHVSDEWGLKVLSIDIKDVEIPKDMQRAMAKEAEAVREKRARIIKAEAEQQAASKLTEAAAMIALNPMALELRRMQMVTEVGAEQNTTTLIMMPSEFVNLAKTMSDHFAKNEKK